ncbi:dihydroflavonol 4-reductase-like [Rhododendron vialii]|uniref:dihydroflavonol 4-reductase-like n=1 Tax=Rhododendron vialii TaxID=182163 RepID=UPI0026605B88|nr:dihydroflavonol 4-reductase-like [Rhododendron vialii]
MNESTFTGLLAFGEGMGKRMRLMCNYVAEIARKQRYKHFFDTKGLTFEITHWFYEFTQGITFFSYFVLKIDHDWHDKFVENRSRFCVQNEVIKPTVNGVLNIMRSCCKAKTVKRLIYTSTTGTVAVQRHPQPEFNESFWTDIDFCKDQKMTAWMYFVAKTLAEKAAWEFAKEHGLDHVTIHPSVVIGPFITPSRPLSIDILLPVITRNEALYPMVTRDVHLDDVCNAHIYLFEHPEAEGRYICSSHCFTILDLAKLLSRRYPEYNIPTKFEGVDESLKPVSCSSKKLVDLGFKFKYNGLKSMMWAIWSRMRLNHA